MNNKMVKFAAFALALFMVFQFSGCGGKRSVTAKDPKRYIRDHDLTHLPKFDIPMEMNDRVVAWLEYFQGPGSGHFRRYLERSGRYMPLMQEILRRQGVPKDLIYIALIESGFNTQARSWASAVGPWQFIQSTGRLYGLKNDGWVDERRDPYKSTVAAANFFKDLYEQFGDWYLAMAAYNGGPGRVKNAIESTGSRNFWEMADDKRAFRAETRDYVPKFIAAAIIAKSPERFGFDRIDYKPPFDFDKGAVETQTDLSIIAKCAGVSEDDIVDLNPHLVRGATPPDAHNYEIRLPKGTSRSFHDRYAALPKEERIQLAHYTTRPGDTLAKVARRYGVSSSQLASINNIRQSRKRHLEAGLTLTIPRGGSSRYAASDEGDSRTSGKGRITHTMRRGETLSSIASRYGVSQRQLASWNNIKKNRKLHAGTRLVINVPRGKSAEPSSSDVSVATKEYKVQRGDTIATIARRYGVSQKQLMAMNGIASNKGLKAGTKLVVRKVKVQQRATDDSDSGGDGGGEVAVSKREHTVQRGDTLSTIARRYGVTTNQLLAMNNVGSPKALKPGTKIVVHKLRLKPEDTTPEQTSAPIAIEETKSGPQEKARGAEHKIESGETLGAIAQKYNVSTKELMAMNNIKNPKAVRAGTKLVIGPPTRSEPKSAQKVGARTPAQSQEVSVAVEPIAMTQEKKPESLSDNLVAEIKDTSTETNKPGEPALQENTGTPVKLASIQQPKAQATQPAAKPSSKEAKGTVVYKVKSGDTLWDIARKHKVSIAEIQRLNKLSDPSAVKPGATITIR